MTLATAAPSARGTSVLLGLFPPAMIAGALMFWGLAPDAVTSAPGTILAAILALEVVAERHASWRMTPPEFATDLFCNVVGYTLIGWCTRFLAEEPLTSLKAAASRPRGSCSSPSWRRSGWRSC
jgi:hypothetical protein